MRGDNFGNGGECCGFILTTIYSDNEYYYFVIFDGDRELSELCTANQAT